MIRNLRKWYFSINEDGFQGCIEQITASVRSCHMNTSLEPICIYGGTNQGNLKTLNDLGVTVIPHVSTIEPELREGYGERFSRFSGHWLRVDIPTIETDDDWIIYTDTDVVFLKDPKDIEIPDLLSAAPEFKKDDYSKFNSGVMVMNLPNLRKVQGEFIKSIKDRLVNNFTYPAHDQESYNRFFNNKFSHLPPKYNWKVYWGVDPSVEILHLHGPKFKVIERLRKGDESGIPAGHIRLWKKSPEAYEYYQRIYEKYL